MYNCLENHDSIYQFFLKFLKSSNEKNTLIKNAESHFSPRNRAKYSPRRGIKTAE